MKPEKICDTIPFENGAEPNWSRGNTPIVRVGDRVFVTNSHVHADRLPRNRTTLEIWEKKDGEAWRLVFEDTDVYQREPCPILRLNDHMLAVTVNPSAQSYGKDEETFDVTCIPMMYIFDVSGELRKVAAVTLPWDQEENLFQEHSYRGFTQDPDNGNIFLTNIEYKVHHDFCYALLNRKLECLRTGKLDLPERTCYHDMAMRGKELYVFGVRDITEPNPEWKAYKFQVTGKQWDYDFRKICLNYCPNIENADFEPIRTICSRDETCGWTNNYDCWYDKNGDMLLLVSCQNVTSRFMRDRFFPDVPLESTLEVYRFSKGKLIEKTEIDHSSEEDAGTLYSGFFHTAESGDVYLLWSKRTDIAANPRQSGMYLQRADDLTAEPVKFHDEYGWLFGSKTRLGGVPSDVVDLYWPKDNKEIMYGRIDLNDFE